METILLASGSPRRRELLAMAGIPFEVYPTDADESFAEGTPPHEVVQKLARRKAEAAAARFPKKTVLAADTIVTIGGSILGKPTDFTDACRMISLLSGRTHEVYTGVCVQTPSRTVCEYDRTLVEFYRLTEREIADYASTGEPYDKAGAYAVQGRGALLVRGIQGDYYSVMGLPISRVHRILRDLQVLF